MRRHWGIDRTGENGEDVNPMRVESIPETGAEVGNGGLGRAIEVETAPSSFAGDRRNNRNCAAPTLGVEIGQDLEELEGAGRIALEMEASVGGVCLTSLLVRERSMGNESQVKASLFLPSTVKKGVRSRVIEEINGVRGNAFRSENPRVGRNRFQSLRIACDQGERNSLPCEPFNDGLGDTGGCAEDESLLHAKFLSSGFGVAAPER